MKVLDFIAWLLVVIGALNWGLVGIFGFNFVHFVFQTIPIFEQITYIVVGIAGLYAILRFKKVK